MKILRHSTKLKHVNAVCALLFLSVCAVLPSHPVLADPYTDYGMAMLQKRDFAAAQKYFDQRLKLAPLDTKALYYKAVCCHHSKNIEMAKSIYKTIVKNFPKSAEAPLAEANLRKIIAADSTTSTTASPTTSAATPSKTIPTVTTHEDHLQPHTTGDIIPASTRVYFKRSGKGDDIIVDGEINGRPIEMLFDTGASGMFLGKNHLSQLGINVSDRAKTSIAGGIGGVVKTTEVELVVSLGGIKKKLKCMVADEFDQHPLLGQTFFNDLEYEFDNKGNCIYFRKATVRNIAKDPYSVPFRRLGNHLIVEMEGSSGTKTAMIVDTGASMTCLTSTNMQQLGLTVPDGAQQMMLNGVGGQQLAYTFTVPELRLGPVIQRDCLVTLPAGGSGMLSGERPHGLLGQPFFSAWRFTVDNQNKCLRFFH